MLVGNRNRISRSQIELDTDADPAYMRLYNNSKSRFWSLHTSMDAGIDKLKEHNLEKSRSEYFHSERAGPGAYNLPQLLGAFTMDANKKNSPSYSIGQQKKDQLLVLSRPQAESVKGSASPGVWKYSSELLTVKSKAPIAIIGREKRFNLDKVKEKLAKSIPHFYDNIDRNSIKENSNRTNGFNKFPRFGERDIRAKELSETPSSHSYNHFMYNTIAEKLSKVEPYSRNSYSKTKSTDRFESHNYYKELEKGYLSQDGPGPAAYSTENRQTLSNFRMSFNGSFTREKRNVSSYMPKVVSPGPQSYDTNQAHGSLNTIKGAGTIGKGKKGIDFTLVHPQFNKHVIKGLL